MAYYKERKRKRMEILSRIEDKRINSWNIFVVITIGDYLNFAEDILENNDMQRKNLPSLCIHCLNQI